MKKLLIVESPAKIKTIAKFLGKDFIIKSTVGHIIDLPPKKIGVAIEKGHVVIDYDVMKDKQKVIDEICDQAKKASEIYLAPDPDREGEIIAWHIGNKIKEVANKKSVIKRITFNEITADAIHEALENPRDIDMDKVSAQQARRVLDRWVGYEVSPILWQKIKKGLSAGRVQSVALRLITDREQAIADFKPEEYWTIESIFTINGAKLTCQLAQINKKTATIESQKKATAIVQDLPKQQFVVSSVVDKTRSKNPYPPFMTSTLQQAAYNKLGFSVKKTMQVAQRLYEGLPLQDSNSPVALITYMRSDSLRIAESALKQVRTLISSQHGADYLPAKAVSYAPKGSAKTQDAHEAIRPVDVRITPDVVAQYVSSDEAKLYRLIWQRFVACQMTPALYAQRQVVINGGPYTFKITGSTLKFDGFLRVYASEEEDDEKTIKIPAAVQEKLPASLQETKPEQHFTQPPPRFNESSLVKELEKEGIGRPSTVTQILATIQAREYTTLDTKKRFIPTELGKMVTHLLVDNLPKIMDVKFTAHMEEDLDKIAQGELDRDKLLTTFYADFSKDLTSFKGSNGKGRQAVLTDIDCPTCKVKKLAIRFGKAGEFLGCTGFPECSFTSNFTRQEDGTIILVQQAPVPLLDETCPQCGKQLRQIQGKFGPFIACSGYPECKYIKQQKASFSCPSCGTGEIVARSWKGGKFWGCSNYPTCKFAIFSDIVDAPCPECKSPYLLKKTTKKGTIITCPNKDCGYSVSE
ncbi:type I DNA topoisomerase [Candidatus Dependentiae bacterium]|nr:type I DNA topoisomerase [Candidatus Dependentiae bacterium]